MDEQRRDITPFGDTADGQPPRERPNYLPSSTRPRSTTQNPKATRFMPPEPSVAIDDDPASEDLLADGIQSITDAVIHVEDASLPEATDQGKASNDAKTDAVPEAVSSVPEEPNQPLHAAPAESLPGVTKIKGYEALDGLPRQQTRERRQFSVILRTQGRALSEALMTIAGTRQRSGRLWLTTFVTFVVITLLIVQVYYRHREINLGYELSKAISNREALLEENRKLRIELRVLSLRERLEPLAGKQLGMTTIQPEQVLIVDTGKKKTKATRNGQRRDGLDNVKRIGE